MEANSLITSRTKRLLWGGLGLGALLVATAIPSSPLRAWSGFFTSSYFLLTACLGGAIFLALARVSGARWHVGIRGVPRAMTACVPLASLPVAVAIVWRFAELTAHKHSSGHAGTFWFKELWLEPAFWLGRGIACLALWSLMCVWFVRRWRRRDKNLPIAESTGDLVAAVVFLVVVALTVTIAGVDWTMALEPEWFSTMWGVYQFAGMFQAGLAMMVLLTIALVHRDGKFALGYRTDHLHDLGKLLIGFSCFWMYIWFCQYMLIWYSNIPEETSYFMRRMHGSWGPVVVASLIANWGIPFFLLLPQPSKRSVTVMKRVALVVLIGRWLDLHLMVAPSLVPGEPVLGFPEIGSLLLISCGAPLILAIGVRNRASTSIAGDVGGTMELGHRSMPADAR